MARAEFASVLAAGSWGGGKGLPDGAWEVAEKLDEPLDAMLTGDVEVATRHFETTTAA